VSRHDSPRCLFVSTAGGEEIVLVRVGRNGSIGFGPWIPRRVSWRLLGHHAKK
jgi:hypothetical protein